MEAAIQEIYDCADDATEKFNMYVTAMLESTQAVSQPSAPMHLDGKWTQNSVANWRVFHQRNRFQVIMYLWF